MSVLLKVSGIALLAGCLGVLIMCNTGKFATCGDKGEVVVVIDSHLIGKEEFAWRMNGLRSACIGYFMQQYHTAYDGPAFWIKRVGDTTPLEWIKEHTLHQLTAEKVKITIMQRYGVLQGFNYHQLMVAFEKENTQRKELVEKGQVIYGLQQFDQNSFYEYVLTNALLETERRISEQYPLVEKEMEEYYNQVKHDTYKIPPTFNVTYVVFNKDQTSSTKYQHLLQLAAAGDYLKIATAINEKGYEEVVHQTGIMLTPASRKTDELKWGALMPHALAFTKATSVSPVFENEEGDSCFLLCREILDNGCQTLSDVRDHVKKNLAAKRFNDELAKAMGRVSVKRCPVAWDRLTIE